MKVISLLQPWASLVVLGHKKVETRSWDTKHRGPLLIHASASKSGLKLINSNFWDTCGELGVNIDTLPYGAIIGQANLVETFRFGYPRSIEYLQGIITTLGHGAASQECMFGDWSEGRYGWLFDSVEEFFLPTPAKGKLQLWDFNESDLMVFPNDLDKISAK